METRNTAHVCARRLLLQSPLVRQNIFLLSPTITNIALESYAGAAAWTFASIRASNARRRSRAGIGPFAKLFNQVLVLANKAISFADCLQMISGVKVRYETTTTVLYCELTRSSPLGDATLRPGELRNNVHLLAFVRRDFLA